MYTSKYGASVVTLLTQRFLSFPIYFFQFQIQSFMKKTPSFFYIFLRRSLQPESSPALLQLNGSINPAALKSELRGKSIQGDRNSSKAVTQLSFTSPTVDVGPLGVRDEVMQEIVNKPLTPQGYRVRLTLARPGLFRPRI